MTRITFSQLIAGALVSLCLATVPARALNDHTYVSGKGADTGVCTTPATACRTFAFAITQTAASGKIIAIDPANYSPVTITKSISIVADGGGPAGIFIATGTAITINAGAKDIVNLRGLTLDGSGTASVGISNTASGSVTITDCFIRRFNGDGIVFGLGAGTFLISNTVSADNTGAGLNITNPPLVSPGVIDHFTASGDNIGISVYRTPSGSRGAPSPFVTIVDSVMMNNVSDGLVVKGPGGPGVIGAVLASSVVTGNGIGVNVGFDGTVLTYGDNEINNNVTADVSGTLTPVAKR